MCDNTDEFFFFFVCFFYKIMRNVIYVVLRTSGHANFRMLSPRVCRLTLVLLVFCWGRSSPVFPCMSSETGSKRAASVERSSESPSSSFLALLENGHSPDIFSSFSFAQNIFVAVCPDSYSLSSFRGKRSWSSSCVLCEKFHHLLRSHARWTVLPATRRLKWSAPKSRLRIQYSLKTRTGARWSGTIVAKTNENLEKKRTAGQSVDKWGWCCWTTYQQ